MMLAVDAETNGMDAVFRALADPTRRLLLDRLRERNGQTLGELCTQLGMARQSATQHLDVLHCANLVTVVRRGRERLHHLNPVPIHQVQERWISAFDRPRLSAISAITQQAEEQAMATSSSATGVPDYVYVTYTRASAEQVWHALTDADLTARYWGHANVSDWQTGSTWEHRRTDGSEEVDVAGRVLESVPPTRLVVTFQEPAADGDGDPVGEPSVVTFAVSRTRASSGSPSPMSASRTRPAMTGSRTGGRPCWRTSSRSSRQARGCRPSPGRWHRCR